MNVEQACKHIEELGYVVIEGLLDKDEATLLDALAREVMERESSPRESCYTNLEGALNYLPELVPLCIHPMMLEIVEYFLGSPFFFPQVCMKWCPPGTTIGGLHSDWPLQYVQKPYPPWPLLLQTMWMLSDFTADNGATHIVPGSHLWGEPPTPDDPRAAEKHHVIPEGPKGSILIWHGTAWHCSGANTTTDRHRMGANLGFFPWFVHRPPDEWPLVRQDLYATFPPRLQQMLERSQTTNG